MGVSMALVFWFVIVVNCSQIQPALCVFCVTSGALALYKIVLLDGKCFVILAPTKAFCGVCFVRVGKRVECGQLCGRQANNGCYHWAG